MPLLVLPDGTALPESQVRRVQHSTYPHTAGAALGSQLRLCASFPESNMVVQPCQSGCGMELAAGLAALSDEWV